MITTEPALTMESVTKRFGAQAALDQLSLNLPVGSFTGLLGRNGAGKTTTLRILLGLAFPDAGELRVLGCDPADPTQRAQLMTRIGYVSETPNAPKFLSLDTAIKECQRAFPKWDNDLAGDLVDRFDLEKHKPFGRLSKGDLAKSQFVLAMARGPELLILDEPTNGFDPLARREFFRTLLDIAGTGLTVLLASHLLEEVERVCDRITVIHNGKVSADGEISVLVDEGISLEEMFFEQTNSQTKEGASL